MWTLYWKLAENRYEAIHSFNLEFHEASVPNSMTSLQFSFYNPQNRQLK